MSYLQQIDSPPAANAEVQVNENFDSIEHSAVYGNDPTTTTIGLVRGYLGGNWGSFTPSSSTHTFGGSATTYVSVNRSTGALDFSTSSTNFDDSANYATVEIVVSGTSTISSVSNRRGGPGGVHGQVDTSGTGDVVGPGSATDGDIARFDGTTGKLLKAGIALDTDVTLAANSDTKVATQKAVKAAIAAAVAGLSWKQAVRAATTVAGTLATSFENGDAIDGVTLATGDRILIKNQATASENGIYVVAASGAPSRATDADSGAELVNASVYVSEGTTLADTQWTCSTNATITLGSTSIAFAQLTAGGGGGSTQGLHDIWIGAGSWYADVTAPPTWGEANGATDQPDSKYWSFDPTTEQAIWTVLEMPKSWDEGTISFHLKWLHGSTATNFGTVWSMRAVAIGDSDSLAANYGTGQTTTDTGGTASVVYSTPDSPAITVAGTPATRDLVFLELRRKPGDGSDTLAVAASVFGATIQINTNADTDA